jgi:hypothetical protein
VISIADYRVAEDVGDPLGCRELGDLERSLRELLRKKDVAGRSGGSHLVGDDRDVSVAAEPSLYHPFSQRLFVELPVHTSAVRATLIR